MSNNDNNRPLAQLAWFSYALTATLLAISLVWGVYSKGDYGYSFWYEKLDIAEHIQTYGPHNRYRDGFERLQREDYEQLFAQITRAVHNRGAGLSTITYQPPGMPATTLLHHDEVVHLQDVADLIYLGSIAFWVLLLCWLPLAWTVYRLGAPQIKWRLTSAALPLVAILLWLLIAGPKAVFYQLHIWLFPPENPWFFYWEESLMATVMKAPYLFGGIAAVIAFGAVVMTPAIYYVGLRVTARVLSKPAGS